MQRPDDVFPIRELPSMRIAVYRMRVPYDKCGPGFAKVCRHAGRHVLGKPFTLYHAAAGEDGIADLETCVPVGPAVQPGPDIAVRDLPACRALTYRHVGPWNRLGEAWNAVMAYIEEQGLEFDTPTREVYLKGPGMIFKGNPDKYVTEIQVPLKTTVD